MRAGIMQPYFFPYIGYFQLINYVDVFLIYGHVSFRKKSWITRNQLKDKSLSTSFYYGIPVKKQSSNKLIHSVEIDNAIPWRKKILSYVQTNYGRASFFNETYPLIKEVLDFQSNQLMEFNTNSIKVIAAHLGINTPILGQDYRDFEAVERQILSRSHPKLDQKSIRIIELCKQLSCDTYINPQGGTELYDKKLLSDENLTLNFLQSRQCQYEQFAPPFIPNLSIIDVLMHTGKNQIQQHLNAFTIV